MAPKTHRSIVEGLRGQDYPLNTAPLSADTLISTRASDGLTMAVRIGALPSGASLPGTTAATLGTADIQAAITAAGVNGLVNLPAGTSPTQTAALVPLAGQTIRGAGIGVTTLLAPVGAGNSVANVFNLSAAGVRLQQLTIDGQYASQTYGQSQSNGCGVYVTANNARLEDVEVKNTINMGISASTANDLIVRRCRITNLGLTDATAGGYNKGIYLGGGLRPRILDNYFEGWSQAIGLWYSVKDALVRGNYLLNNYGYEDAAHTVPRSAVEDYGATTGYNQRNVYQNNYVDGSTHNCFEIAQGGDGLRFIGNITRNPGSSASGGQHFEVTGDSVGNTTDVLIQGNAIYCDASQTTKQIAAVSLVGTVARIAIADNLIRDNKSSGAAIFVGGTAVAGSVVISGNALMNCALPIRLNNNPNGMVVTGNLIEVVTGSNAIYLGSGSNHIIVGNTISIGGTNNGNGVQVATGNAHLIEGNTVQAIGGACIVVTTNDNRITNNQTVRTTYTGAGNIDISGNRNVVTGNYGDDTGYRTIHLFGAADYNIVRDNRCAVSPNDVVNDGTGTHNVLEPNHSPTYTRLLVPKPLASQTVGTAQVTVAHGLGYTPTVVQISMTSAGTIWRSAASDATSIYLTADLAGRTADVYVR